MGRASTRSFPRRADHGRCAGVDPRGRGLARRALRLSRALSGGCIHRQCNLRGKIAGQEQHLSALLRERLATLSGPVDLHGHELVVGPSAHLNSEVHAGDVVAYGRVVGPVHAQGRVDIKKDGSIIGDISSARISIEDGAHFKGRIEIDYYSNDDLDRVYSVIVGEAP